MPTYRSFWRPVRLILLVSFFISLAACGGSPTEAPKSFTVGVINLASNLDLALAGFKAAMTSNGYTEGKNITYVYSGPAGDQNKLEPIAQGLVASKVDLILALGTPAAKAAQKATGGTNIPVVFVPVADPVAAGLVPNLTKPGGNVTGVTPGTGASGRQLEWLKKAVPSIKRVYVPYNPTLDSSIAALKSTKEAATILGLELVLSEAGTNDELTAALAALPDNVDSMYLLPDALVVTRIDDLVKLCISRKLPLSAPRVAHVNSGAFVAFGSDDEAMGKQAARLADKIFKGSKPADLPVEVGEYYLGINLKTAQAIGVTVSDEILRQATVIVR